MSGTFTEHYQHLLENKQVGLLVAGGIRELFPSTVGDWKKPYS